MKNRNIVITGMVCALAFALAPVSYAFPRPDGGPTPAPANERPSPDGGPIHLLANEGPRPDGGPVHQSSTARANANSEASSAYEMIPEGENRPVVTIHSTDNVTRGKTGSFVLDMKPALMFGATYVNFSVSGTAIPGVDYVAFVSPAYIGQSGYGTILVQTLPNPRGPANHQAYSVVVTLESGLGYFVGQPGSATIWIKP